MKKLLLPIFLLSFFSEIKETFADGTKQISPTQNDLTALHLNQDRNTGAYYGCDAGQRIYFNIADLNERIYLGSRWYDYANTSGFSSKEVTSNMYYRVFDPSGAVVQESLKVKPSNSSNKGVITDFSKAVAGPNRVGFSSGYEPVIFTPTVTGDYSIQIYYKNGSTVSPSRTIHSPFFDFNVVKESTGEIKEGRVYSKKWGFSAVENETNFPTKTNTQSKASVYSYSLDQTIVKLSFGNGFMPMIFDLYVNDHGVEDNGNWLVDRKSKTTLEAPDAGNGFKLFLTRPDAVLYPVPEMPSFPKFAANPITGCTGSYVLHVVMPSDGDLKVFLDINGVEGYQPGTSDLVIEKAGLSAGPVDIDWDGFDGLGNEVLEGASVSLEVVYARGRFNLPLYDAEINKGGIILETIAPITSATNRLYWDDSGLTNIGSSCGTSSSSNNNITGAGINNSTIGSITPAHAWNGNGNPDQLIPAPAAGKGDSDALLCNDFGNVRVINSWGWALQQSTVPNFITFGCFDIAGNVYNDVDGLTDNLIDGVAIATLDDAPLYVYLVDVDQKVIDVQAVGADGKFLFTDVKGYQFDFIVSTEVKVLGDVLTSSVIPDAWDMVGEQLGTIAGAGLDGTPDLKRTLIISSDVTDLNFGIQRRPVATITTLDSVVNPGGVNLILVDALTVGNDYDGGVVSSMTITSFPEHIDALVINGFSYTSGTFPFEGIVLTTDIDGKFIESIGFDPVDGISLVSIPFYVTDNGNATSNNTGSIDIPVKTLSISGKILNDANGIEDALVNGNVINNSAYKYYLLDNVSGLVVAVATVNASDEYVFDQLSSGDYSVMVSKNDYVLGDNTVLVALDSLWRLSSEGLGSAYSNLEAIDGKLNLGFINSNVSEVYFGLNKLNTSFDVYEAVDEPVIGHEFILDGLAGNLGSPYAVDYEDGTLDNGATIVITTVPLNALLKYNGVALVSGEVISSFNPSLLIAEVTDATVGTSTIVFDYQYLDAAQMSSINTGRYTIDWDSPLPVSLGNWNAVVYQGNKSLLSWSTYLEVSNKGFAVQRNTSGVWEEIGFVVSGGEDGNSHAHLQYEFVDQKPASGLNQYRLVQLDFNGSRYFSTVKALSFSTSGLLGVYPNPAVDYISISGIGADEIKSVQVLDMHGRMLQSHSALSSTTLDVSGLVAGTYVIVIEDLNGKVSQFKFVKQ